MSRKNIEDLCGYLDESFESDSDYLSFVDNSYADPDYRLPSYNQNVLPTTSGTNAEIQDETSGEESFELL